MSEPVRRVHSLDGDGWTVHGYVPGEMGWRQVGHGGSPPPSSTGAVRALVPGDVVADCRDAGLIPDPTVGRNSLAAEWVAARDWVYTRPLEVPAAGPGERLVLCFDGVDETCEVFLNGSLVAAHHGTNTTFEAEVTGLLRHDGGDLVTVLVEHAPHEPEAQGQLGRTSLVRSWKPRFAYGWDFCTRLVTVGIWDSVRLEVRGEAWLRDPWSRCRRAGDGWDLDVEVTVSASPSPLAVEAVLTDESGATVGSATVAVPAALHDRTAVVGLRSLRAAPWNVNGAGAAVVHRCTLALRGAGRDLDAVTIPVGLREVGFERTAGAPRDALPYALVVNGRRTLIRGWNWVPVDQLYGRPLPERYEHLVETARAAGCNLLRVWGGGHLERQLFYDLCDRAGILVWQEFPQSSSGLDSVPAEDGRYLEMARQQARGMIVRRRMHPSLALWCGGNELAGDGRVPLHEGTSPVLQVLAETVAELDPGRAYLPTSPSGPIFDTTDPAGGAAHDVHGGWWFMGDPEHFDFYDRCRPMLHSEFGAEGAAGLASVARHLGDAAWPPDHSNPTWVHHGGSWWTNRERVTEVFGEIDELGLFLRASRYLQALALPVPIEAQLRRQDSCAGVIPWQLNEPWPNASCTSVVDHTGVPKPAYWAVASCYRPLLLSVRRRRIAVAPGGELRAEVWVCGERQSAVDVAWTVRCAEDGRTVASGSAGVAPGGDRAVLATEVRVQLPAGEGVFVLEARGSAAAAVEPAQVVFSSAAPLLAGLLRGGGSVRLETAGADAAAVHAVDAPAHGVSLLARGGAPGPGLDRGWLATLWPGAPVTVRVRPGTAGIDLETLSGVTATLELDRT